MHNICFLLGLRVLPFHSELEFGTNIPIFQLSTGGHSPSEGAGEELRFSSVYSHVDNKLTSRLYTATGVKF